LHRVVFGGRAYTNVSDEHSGSIFSVEVRRFRKYVFYIGISPENGSNKFLQNFDTQPKDQATRRNNLK
jgi:hypothetical protein